jgi:chromosome segregation ATPase
MRHYLQLFLIVSFAAVLSTTARAESEADRLREALRSATGQVRTLEDQRAALQAKATAAEQERDRLRKQNETLRAQIKEAEQAYRQAVKDFNDRIAERDDALEKWKSAYAEAATVARAKDAERAKFLGEATALKASNKACEAKNTQLVKVGNDIVTQYEAMNPFEKILDHEPVFGLKRVEHQNTVQDLRDKVLDQKVKP